MEELLSRHRKEIRDLTSRITQKKKQATKKTRRGVNEECESMERELRARHAEEIASLEKPDSTAEPEPELEPEDEPAAAAAVQDPSVTESATTTTASSNLGTTSTNTSATSTSIDPPPLQPARKPNRQKARAARRAAELAALSAEDAESGASPLPNAREAEITAMSARLSELGLTMKEIAPDGHCLYSAFADQLPEGGEEVQKEGGGNLKGYRLARKKCADYMRAHRDEFEPFLEGAFDEHVRKVEETAEWGGHAEILALAKAFGVTVNVVQAQGRVERMNNEGGAGDRPEVWLGYYRHSFGLGEHYNSLRKKDGY